MTSSIEYRATLSQHAGIRRKNRQIALANRLQGQYSVQDSFMHLVAKWGISAGIFGGVDTAGSPSWLGQAETGLSLRNLVKRNAKR